MASSLEAVLLLPQRQLLLRAVGAGIRRGVAGEAVGDHVQEHRAAAFQEDLLLALDGVGHRQRVVAVDPLGVHGIGVDPGAQARELVKAHGLPFGLPPHAVEVVEEIEQDRRGPSDRLVPEVAILVHG
jgi:hypothetical protein